MQPTVPLARNVRGGVIVHVRGHHPSRAVLLIRSVFVVRVSEVVLADLFARARRQVPASASSSSSSSVRCRDSKRITFALVARRVDAPHAPVQYLRPAFRRAVRRARGQSRDRRLGIARVASRRRARRARSVAAPVRVASRFVVASRAHRRRGARFRGFADARRNPVARASRRAARERLGDAPHARARRALVRRFARGPASARAVGARR